jgi:pimeloyl-ACP methyl ester carboxylesterase
MALPTIKSFTVGQGKPLVLLHAFPLSHSMWKRLHPPAGHRFVLPDFPGFGFSPLPADADKIDFTLISQALQEHLKGLGLKEPFALGGISMGGYWAMEFARLFPDSIEKLIFISTRPGVDKPEGRSNRLQMADKVEKEGMTGVAETMTPGLLGKTTLREKPVLAGLVSQWIKDTAPQAVALAQRVMADRRDQTTWLPTLRVKTHLWAGQEDTLIPNVESQAMSKLIPNCEIKIFEGVGHLIPLEDPQSFQTAINAL